MWCAMAADAPVLDTQMPSTMALPPWNASAVRSMAK